jgi:uncharacterized membrane protein YfcA
MMPALIYTGLPPHVVLGTNKVQSACGTAMATLRYHRAGLFAIRPNLPAVAAIFAGALAGALVIQRFDADVLRLVVPLLLMGIALYTVFSPRMDDHDSTARLSERGYRRRQARWASTTASSAPARASSTRPRWSACAGLA